MAYQNELYENLSGRVTGLYNDGNLKIENTSEALQKRRIVSTGTAKKGGLNQVYNVASLDAAMRTFGSESELADTIAQVNSVSPEFNLGLVRIGAKPFHWRLKRTISGVYEKDTLISVVPSFVQLKDSANQVFSTLENLRIVLLPFKDGNLIRQRVILLAINENSRTEFSVVYDSERILIENGEAGFEVKIDVPLGEFLYTEGATGATPITLASSTYTDANIESLSQLKAFHLAGSLDMSANQADTLLKIEVVSTLNDKTVATITDTDYELVTYPGETGEVLSACERYAHNEKAYSALEYDSFDYLHCTGCFADTPAVSLSVDSTTAFAIDWAKHNLGYMWKYEFNGKPYIYMFGQADPFAVADVADSYTHRFSGYSADLTFAFSADNKKLGALLNLVHIYFHPGNGETTSVETFSNEKGIVECHIVLDAPDAASINVDTPFCTISVPTNALANGTDKDIRLRPSLIGADSSVSAAIRAGQAVNNDPFVISHWDLLQEEVPEGVISRLINFPDSGSATATLEAKAIEVREVSFAHQAAQMAWKASSNYNQTIALIPTTKPTASVSGVATWAGNPATYVIQENGSVDVTADGKGILGTKLLAGAVGYRDDAAFGGIILTNGNDLPNEKPYGIDDSDEAKDENGLAIDLGKHLLIIGSWGYINNPGSLFRQANRSTLQGAHFVNAAANIAQMLVDLPAGNEPIGPVNGLVPGIRIEALAPKAVLNNLAALRICMIDQNNVISSIYTSALRTSDYTKLSSIMSSNEIIKRIRDNASAALGTALNDANIQSLQTQMDGMSRALINEGYAQSCTIRLVSSRVDRINGVLNARVNFVPPFSLEAINVDITLEAPTA